MESVPCLQNRNTGAQETQATGPGRPPQGRTAGRLRGPNPSPPHNSEEVPPRETSRHPHGLECPTWQTRQRASAGSPHLRTHTHRLWAAVPSCLPQARQMGECEGLIPDALHKGTRHPRWGYPPASPTAHRASSQERKLYGGCWAPTHASPTPRKHGKPAPAACHKDGQPRQREGLTPGAAQNGKEVPPPGKPPATLAARNAQQGTQAKGRVPGPHACTPAPRACGHWTPATCPKDGRPGGGVSARPQRPIMKTRGALPRNALLPDPQRTTPACNSARYGASAGPPSSTLRAQETRTTGPSCLPKGQADKEGERLTPDAPRNSRRPPPRATSRHPSGAQCPTGHASKRASDENQGLRTRAHSMWAGGPSCLPKGRTARGGASV